MASGCVIEYRGKHGIVRRLKYRDADGRQVQETLGPERDGWTRKRAEAELRDRLVKVEKQGYRKPQALTFKTWAEMFFTEKAETRRWKPATVGQYRSVRERLVAYFGPMKLGAVRPRHVSAYVAETSVGYGAATVNRDVSLLHDIFASAIAEELIQSNPVVGIERPKLPRGRWKDSILTPPEISRIARACTNEQDRVAFLVLVLTGVRRSELQALRWRDVDLIENVLRIRDSKTETGIRSIALAPSLAEALWQWRRATAYSGDDERVFVHPERGTIYRAERFKEALAFALAAAGVEKKLRAFHDLRHASLTNGAAAGESPLALKTRAGHASMATTEIYLHLAGTAFHDEAAALERPLLGDNLVPDLVPTRGNLTEPEETEGA